MTQLVIAICCEAVYQRDYASFMTRARYWQENGADWTRVLTYGARWAF